MGRPIKKKFFGEVNSINQKILVLAKPTLIGNHVLCEIIKQKNPSYFRVQSIVDDSIFQVQLATNNDEFNTFGFGAIYGPYGNDYVVKLTSNYAYTSTNKRLVYVPSSIHKLALPTNKIKIKYDKNAALDKGVLPRDRATFNDLDDVEFTGNMSVNDVNNEVSLFQGGSTSTAVIDNFGTLSGNIWIAATLKGSTTGTCRIDVLSPTFTTGSYSTSREGQHIWKFDDLVSVVSIRLILGSTFDGEVVDLQIYDMNSILSMPADIYIAAGQSLMSCGGTSLADQSDKLTKDYWEDPRLTYYPGTTYSAYGAVIDEVQALVSPLQTDNQTEGVSPIISFARELLHITDVNRRIVVIAASEDGTNLAAPTADWNETSGTVYANAVARVNAAITDLPDGSEVKGFIWAQGESDFFAFDDSTYVDAFDAMLTQFKSDTSATGHNTLIITGCLDTPKTLQYKFVQYQNDMDELSNSAFAVTDVITSNRPLGGILESDPTHPTAENQRLSGKIAADVWINRRT